MLRVQPEQPVPRVIPDLLVQLVTLALRVPKEYKELLELKAIPEQQVLEVRLVRKEFKAFKEFKV